MAAGLRLQVYGCRFIAVRNARVLGLCQFAAVHPVTKPQRESMAQPDGKQSPRPAKPATQRSQWRRRLACAADRCRCRRPATIEPPPKTYCRSGRTPEPAERTKRDLRPCNSPPILVRPQWAGAARPPSELGRSTTGGFRSGRTVAPRPRSSRQTTRSTPVLPPLPRIPSTYPPPRYWNIRRTLFLLCSEKSRGGRGSI
jgi:hypothetical protein